MKYYAKVNGRPCEVELRERLGRLEVRVDGALVPVEYTEVDRLGQLALLVDKKSYGASIEGAGDEWSVVVAGHHYKVEIEDERERAARAAERSQSARGAGVVKSVMPGIVIKLLVKEGERVEAGQALLILEAMKMQNEIAAPAAGKVARIHVAQGQAVSSGEKLVMLAS